MAASESMLTFELMLGEARKGLNQKAAELEAVRAEYTRRREALATMQRTLTQLADRQRAVDAATTHLAVDVVQQRCVYNMLWVRYRTLCEQNRGAEAGVDAAVRATAEHLTSLQHGIRMKVAGAERVG